MAVNLLNSNTARIDFGDILPADGQSGVNALSVAITVKPSDFSGDGARLVTKWGPTDFTWQVQYLATTDDIGFVVNTGGGIKGRQTTTSPLSLGGTFRIVCRWDGNGNTMDIWVNGVSQTVATYVADAAAADMVTNAYSLQVGYETSESAAGVEGDYSELAIGLTKFTDAFVIGYGKGYSPSFFRTTPNSLYYPPILYAPLYTVTDLRDLWGSRTATNSGGTTAPHPSIIMPRRREFYRKATAAGFIPAWAQNSNLPVIGTGIY